MLISPRGPSSARQYWKVLHKLREGQLQVVSQIAECSVPPGDAVRGCVIDLYPNDVLCVRVWAGSSGFYNVCAHLNGDGDDESILDRPFIGRLFQFGSFESFALTTKMGLPPKLLNQTPMPFWFKDQGAHAFKNMRTKQDDVVLSSGVKMGTTWCHRILYLLLHGCDQYGNLLPQENDVGAKGQCYPEGLTTQPEQNRSPLEQKMFGNLIFDDLLQQKGPRLFSTHLFGDKLPASLIAANGAGRLIIMVRNLKDTMCSLHYFRGEPKDGWLGNEHGCGTFERFLSPDCTNAYGSIFYWLKQNDQVAQALAPSQRVIVMCYEEIINDHAGEIARLARFLGLDVSEQKLHAIVEATKFDCMKAEGRDGRLNNADILLRKGGIGGWRDHLDVNHWEEFDRVCNERLYNCELANRFLKYQ